MPNNLPSGAVEKPTNPQSVDSPQRAGQGQPLVLLTPWAGAHQVNTNQQHLMVGFVVAKSASKKKFTSKEEAQRHGWSGAMDTDMRRAQGWSSWMLLWKDR